MGRRRDRRPVERMHVPVLRKIADRMGLDRSLTRKAELISALDRMLVERTDRVVACCTETERNALAEAAHEGGLLDVDLFRAKYGEDPPPRSYNRLSGTGIFGIVMKRSSLEGYLEIDPPFREPLRKALSRPREPEVRTLDSLPREVSFTGGWGGARRMRKVHVHAGAEVAPAEVVRVLELARTSTLRVSRKTGRPAAAAVRAIAEVLPAPEFQLEPFPSDDGSGPRGSRSLGTVRSAAWGRLVQCCGWCRARDGKLVLTASGKRMLSGDPVELRKGYERFLESSRFDELALTAIRGQTGKGRRGLTDVSLRRQGVSQSMKRWPVGRWMEAGEAARFVTALGNMVPVTNDPWNLYFGEKRYGSLGFAGAEGHLERQYARLLLMVSMATLGVVDVAYTAPHGLWPEFGDRWGLDGEPFCGPADGLRFVRLNELGAYCLGLRNEYSPPKRCPGLFRILPDMRLVLVAEKAEPEPLDRALLETFAERESDREWRITPRAVALNLAGGGSIDDVRRALQERAVGDVPESVTCLLDDVESRAGAVSAPRDAVLLRCRDSVTARLLAGDPDLSGLCELAGDDGLVVPAGGMEAFRRAMASKGYVVPVG